MRREAQVRRQYEIHPYPPRDPADEEKRLLATSLEPLPLLNHYGFSGRRDFTRPFRALVAGGGTGDASTYLAHQLRETEAEIVYLDPSAAALEIARERARRRGVEARITFLRGYILDLPSRGLPPFDYVNCSGVLHHLPDPAAGLAALRAVTKEEGLLGIMVYGAYGRSAIYPLQDLLRRLLAGEKDVGARVAAARALVRDLPETSALKRLPLAMLPADLDSDSGLHDLLLHAIDRPFTVPELHALLAGAGLRLVEFAPETRPYYEPRHVLRSPELRARAAALPPEERQAIAELAWGCLSRHVFWASARGDSAADPDDPRNVPFFWGPLRGDPRVAAALRSLEPGRTSDFPLGGAGLPPLTARLTLDAPACLFLRLVDGERTMGEIVAEMCARDAALTREAARAACRETFRTLAAADGLLLRHASVPAL